MFTMRRSLVVFALAFACSDGDSAGYPEGPGGAYDVELACTPYSSGDGPASFCETEEYKHYFQCDEAPGGACAEAPHPSADPDQVAYCCEFPCARDADSDHRCPGRGHAYVCDQDDPSIAAELGCDDGVDQNLICCSID